MLIEPAVAAGIVKCIQNCSKDTKIATLALPWSLLLPVNLLRTCCHANKRDPKKDLAKLSEKIKSKQGTFSPRCYFSIYVEHTQWFILQCHTCVKR